MTDDDIFADLNDDEEEDLDTLIELTDDDGNVVRFEYLDLVEFEGEEYAVLLPEEEDEEADTVVILRVEVLDDDTEAFNSVDDDRILNAVFEIFKERFKDEFNFVD